MANRVVEIRTTSDLMKYINDQRKAALRLQAIVEETADTLERYLRDNAPYERHISARKARKVTDHMRQVAEFAHGQAACFTRMGKAFKREYNELLTPKKSKKTFEWTE